LAPSGRIAASQPKAIDDDNYRTSIGAATVDYCNPSITRQMAVYGSPESDIQKKRKLRLGAYPHEPMRHSKLGLNQYGKIEKSCADELAIHCLSY
jgi:hypothetical protein